MEKALAFLRGIEAGRHVAAAKSEYEVVSATIKEKGLKRFANAFAVAGTLFAVAYFGIYKPPQNRIVRLQAEIEAARAMSKAGSEYKSLKEQLERSYAMLPAAKDRQQWLSNAMIESMRVEKLTPEMFRPVSEIDSGGLIFQTSTVQLSIKFAEAYAWLVRLEAAKPLMQVSSFELVKKQDAVGMNQVSVSVMTAIPKKRFD